MDAKTICRTTLMALGASTFMVLAGGGGGGGCGGSGGTSGGGTSGGGSSGGTTSGGGSSGKPYGGTVILGTNVSAGVSVHSAIAEFLPSSSSAVCPGGTQVGSCCYEPPVSGSTSGGIPTELSVGDITVTDGTTTIGTISLSATLGLYSLTSSMSAFTWAAGDTLGVAAPGATVDAFSGGVKTPQPIAGFTPALSSGPISIFLAGWSPTWTPDSQSGETTYVLFVDTVLHSQLTCTTPDSAGTVSFPASLLANFNSGDTATVEVNRHASSQLLSSNAAVDILAGVTIAGSATLQ